MNGRRPALLRVGACLGAVLVAAAVSAQTTQLDISVSTTKPRYLLGERVVVSVEACNPTGSTVLELFQPGNCGRDRFRVLALPGGELAAHSEHTPWCPPWMQPVQLEPGECREVYTWEWPQVDGGYPLPGDGSQVAAGSYLVHVEEPGMDPEPCRFEITAIRQAPVQGRSARHDS